MNLFGCTYSKAPGMSVFTLNIDLICFIESSSCKNSNGIGVPNSSTLSYESPALRMSPYMSTSLLQYYYNFIANDSQAVSLSHSSSFNNDSVSVSLLSSSQLTRSDWLRKVIGSFVIGRSYLYRTPLKSALWRSISSGRCDNEIVVSLFNSQSAIILSRSGKKSSVKS